ncbi:MAG: phosphatidate cytidylyltransferase [Bdellovibrionaceae bacterium]|jgi:phosphatidate cytidylyltransferase|nr:phosphatidate cytidylyltransferase [Pseudobdellovibrionaceae bacterium]
MNALVTRILSAAVVIIIFAAIYIFFGSKGLAISGSAVIAAGIFEFASLKYKKPSQMKNKIIFLFFSLLILPIIFLLPEQRSMLITALLSLMVSVQIWVNRNQIHIDDLLKDLALSLLGVLYCVIFSSYALRILLIENGDLVILGFMINVFATDTFAYFSGLKFGKNKLMPSLSPKKTMEGALGGLLGSVGCTTIYFYLIPEVTLPLGFLIILSFITSILSQTGDLFESLLKRVAKVKDSGSIMPGHGGILDRLDGFYFAAPVFYTLFVLFSQFT